MASINLRGFDFRQSGFQNFVFPFLLGLLALFILIGISPHQQPNPQTDSGIFLYIGDKLLEGATLYEDAWDHKGPVIFYINALGLLIGGGSRWGVWLLEVAAVVGGTLLGYSVMRREFGQLAAVFGTVIWLISLPNVLEGGNLTEEYGLALQFGAIWLFARADSSSKRWDDLGVGLMMGLAFWMRANIVGLPVAILLVLLWRALTERERIAWLRIAVILGGFLLVGAIIVGYFASIQALEALWDGAFYYNLVYSEDVRTSRLVSILSGLKLLPLLQFFGVSGWLICVSELFQNGRKDNESRSLLQVLVVAGPLELMLVSLSGRTFPHYYMSWLPIFALLSGYLLSRLVLVTEPAARNAGLKRFPVMLTGAMLAAMILVPLTGIVPPVMETIEAAIEAGGVPPVDVTNSRFGLMLDYLTKNSPPDEEVLFWGKLLAINWLSERDVPSRHLFQDHFFTPGYATSEMIQEYINDIEASRPLIIDTTKNRVTYAEISTPLDRIPEVVRPLYEYVQNHYVLVEEMNRYGWWVYRYAEEAER